jgi:hypothetical protein
MTSKDRITAAIEGQPTDYLPFSPFLAYVWEHFPQKIQAMGQLAFHHLVGADPLWRGAPCPVRAALPESVETQTKISGDQTVTRVFTPVGRLELVYRRSETGNTNFLVEHPLKTQSDFKVQMWLEEHTRLEFDASPVAAHLAGEGREGLSLGMLLPRGKSAFQQLVEHLVGTEELVYALADFPETVTELWEIMVARNLEAVRLAAPAAYDYFITWEDSSTQNYSPAQYDQFIGREIGQWCALLAGSGKKYIQHACGHVGALVARMQAHGVFAIESISPPPTGNIQISAARKLIGKMGIIGGIEPTQFLNLTEAELERYVETVIEAARGGPFVLANSDSCPPGVTLEKFKQVAQIARRSQGCIT